MVLVSLRLLPPVEFVVSLPLSAFLSAVISDGFVLRSRLSGVQA